MKNRNHFIAENNTKGGTPRNYGIELLRILSMLMVVILHIQGVGGAIYGMVPFHLNYEVAWLLEAVCFIAVDLYALISGYVGYGRRFHLSSIITLWLQTLFYCFMILVVFTVISPAEISRKNLMQSFFPVLSGQYWYFTAYFAMFFFIPVLNNLLENVSHNKMRVMIAGLVFLFSVLPTIVYRDVFLTGEGYSPLWLSILYLIGGYVKKYDEPTRYSSLKLVTVFMCFTLLTWLSKLCIEKVVLWRLGTVFYGDYFYKYTSPTVLLASISFFLLFSQMNIQNIAIIRVVSFLSAGSFSVYLIHRNNLIWNKYFGGAFTEYAAFSMQSYVVRVLFLAAFVYLACSMIDWARRNLFNLMRIDEFSKWLEGRIMKKIMKLDV